MVIDFKYFYKNYYVRKLFFTVPFFCSLLLCDHILINCISFASVQLQVYGNCASMIFAQVWYFREYGSCTSMVVVRVW